METFTKSWEKGEVLIKGKALVRGMALARCIVPR
jgi:hypothetical protein